MYSKWMGWELLPVEPHYNPERPNFDLRLVYVGKIGKNLEFTKVANHLRVIIYPKHQLPQV
ncbi:hypothetical protein LguiB_022052 [Lonicera macranthoides]